MQSVAEKSKQKSLPVSYKNVASVIPVGKSNAILMKDIASITSISDNRNLYAIIENLIVNYGYPIVASRKGEHRGYFYPSNQRELEEAKTTLRNTINSLEKRYKSITVNYKNTD